LLSLPKDGTEERKMHMPLMPVIFTHWPE